MEENQIRLEESQSRSDLAVHYFKAGYNCAQSVLLAFADRYTVSPTVLKQIGAPLGGGVGRLREICGAVSATAVLLGLEEVEMNPGDDALKTALYHRVQAIAQRFKTRMGSYVCADLLELKRVPQQPRPDDRNAAYYAHRPCAYCVFVAAEILEQELSKKNHSLSESLIGSENA